MRIDGNMSGHLGTCEEIWEQRDAHLEIGLLPELHLTMLQKMLKESANP